ncbi:MAG: pyridoxal-dependent decarboxylase, partial [Candidatus Heimdallarchaeota archaeon]|nr:pyridoxal-dependent decarboxylase [Candidatus Heimdallarchaeota archaeon]
RFWGWVMGSGTAGAMLADMLAAAMNSSPAGFDDASRLVELQVLDWFKELMGFPAGAGGLLVTGGSMANIVALAVARNAQAGFDLRRKGVGGASGPLTLYASDQVHSSNLKAAELLGLGSEALRLLPADGEYRLDLKALREALAADRAAGCVPLAVIANAGSVNTGAIDDIAGLADLCRDEGLWLHVDGAFGALAALSPKLRPLLAGLERADSLAFDLHKWGYLPYDVGCVLVRDAELQRATFTFNAEYLAPVTGGIWAAEPKFADRGPLLSRGFRALKIWMAFKEHGVEAFGRLIEQNVEQAAYLRARVEARSELEVVAPAPLNVVCFRYNGGLAEERLDELNAALLVRLQESGLAVPSSTQVGGRLALRAAITNHRSRREDFDLLVREVTRLGDELARAPRSEGASKGEGR